MERAESKVMCGTERAGARADVPGRVAAGSSNREEGVEYDEAEGRVVGCDESFVAKERRASVGIWASVDGLQPLVSARSARYLESDSLQPHCLKEFIHVIVCCSIRKILGNFYQSGDKPSQILRSVIDYEYNTISKCIWAGEFVYFSSTKELYIELFYGS